MTTAVMVDGSRCGKTEPSEPAQAHVRKPSPPAGEEPGAGPSRCDLRGLRVDEALDRLVEALDRAASAGRAHFVVIHGIGTGALRRAVREHLAESPYVRRFLAGAPEEGGEGVTTVDLA